MLPLNIFQCLNLKYISSMRHMDFWIFRDSIKSRAINRCSWSTSEWNKTVAVVSTLKWAITFVTTFMGYLIYVSATSKPQITTEMFQYLHRWTYCTVCKLFTLTTSSLVCKINIKFIQEKTAKVRSKGRILIKNTD